MKEINFKSWALAEQYEVFSKLDNPYYCVTTKLDITNVYNFAKSNNISFYFCLGHIIHTALSMVEEFNIRVVNNKLIADNHNILSFACKNVNERKFRYVDVPYNNNIVEFCKTARSLEQQQHSLHSNVGFGQNYSIYISCVPWISVTSVTQPKENNNSDFVPRITWDKFVEENGKKLINVSFGVNHRTIDGYAISQVVLNAENLIKNLK